VVPIGLRLALEKVAPHLTAKQAQPMAALIFAALEKADAKDHASLEASAEALQALANRFAPMTLPGPSRCSSTKQSRQDPRRAFTSPSPCPTRCGRWRAN